MGALSRLRKWANRDDGRFYQIGNESIDVLTVVGVLVLIGALILWQLHSQVGISSVWAIAVGIVGLALLVAGGTSGSNGSGT
jgi:hypothetical protein